METRLLPKKIGFLQKFKHHFVEQIGDEKVRQVVTPDTHLDYPILLHAISHIKNSILKNSYQTLEEL